jgi:thiol-disulfide isomerase/thioredoxin
LFIKIRSIFAEIILHMYFKSIFLLALMAITVSCGTASRVIVNRKVVTKSGDTELIGQFNADALFKYPEFKTIYLPEYEAYQPNKQILKKIKPNLFLYKFEVYIGSWCQDSQREVPRFLKIMDEINIPKNKISMYALNRKKESFYGEQVQKNIQKVPTFIVYRGGIEIGRIVEAPAKSIEISLYEIIKDKPYEDE